MEYLPLPKLSKWPFLTGDVLLVVFAGLVIDLSPRPIDLWLWVASGVCLVVGAGLTVTPFLLEYQALLKRCETEALLSTMTQLQQLERISGQITGATAQWQAAHELAQQTSRTAREVAERMEAEAREFRAFFEKANDAEKNHLRLEVEKLRRDEGHWLRVTTVILDHVFALHQAGLRSGQAELIGQLGRFQFACRDVARRVGLVPIEAAAGDEFDPKLHQLPTEDAKPPAGARVRQTLATGFSFQGDVLRRVVVDLVSDPVPAEVSITGAAPLAAISPAPAIPGTQVLDAAAATEAVLGQITTGPLETGEGSQPQVHEGLSFAPADDALPSQDAAKAETPPTTVPVTESESEAAAAEPAPADAAFDSAEVPVKPDDAAPQTPKTESPKNYREGQLPL